MRKRNKKIFDRSDSPRGLFGMKGTTDAKYGLVAQKKMRNPAQEKVGFSFALGKKRDNTTYIQKWMKDGKITFENAKTIPREIISFPIDIGRVILDPRNKRLQRRSLIGKVASQSRKTKEPLNAYLKLAGEQSKFVINKFTHPIESLKEQFGSGTVETWTGILSSQQKKKHKKYLAKRSIRTVIQGLRGRVA